MHVVGRWAKDKPQAMRADNSRLLPLTKCAAPVSGTACTMPHIQIINGDESTMRPLLPNSKDHRFDYRIGRVVFEVQPQEDWMDAYKAMDEIWVPSKFHQQWLVDRGLDASRTVVVPEAVSMQSFAANTEWVARVREKLRAGAGKDVTFRFLSVFAWDERKGYVACVTIALLCSACQVQNSGKQF